jgi:hypothetical protein
MFQKLLLWVLPVAALSGLSGFAQAIVASSQERAVQPILMKGQQVQGVMVLQDGTAQSVTCPSPQPYVTADGTSTGWACFDEATGAWLMNAETPVYKQPSKEYDYYSSPYPYPYPYPYYPYYYGGPFWGAPFSGFGTGNMGAGRR